MEYIATPMSSSGFRTRVHERARLAIEEIVTRHIEDKMSKGEPISGSRQDIVMSTTLPDAKARHEANMQKMVAMADDHQCNPEHARIIAKAVGIFLQFRMRSVHCRGLKGEELHSAGVIYQGLHRGQHPACTLPVSSRVGSIRPCFGIAVSTIRSNTLGVSSNWSSGTFILPT